MKIKKKSLILLTIILFGMLSPLKVNAALQANGSEATGKGVDYWIENIRKMEAAGGTLGLTDTISSTDLTSSGTSNNLDIHMQKNTEYGAMVILSASAYGNPNPIAEGDTTTGNQTGVVMDLNKEWVSAGAGITGSTTYKNAVGKYKNEYSTTYSNSPKFGDAIKETEGWHGSGASTWLNDTNSSGLLRAYSGSVFSYYGLGSRNGSAKEAHYTKTRATRAVIVIGNGF